jgi:hypothetical protein
MPRAGFEPAIPATKRPKTYALERAATGIGVIHVYRVKYFVALIRIARWKAEIQTEGNPKHNTTEKA